MKNSPLDFRDKYLDVPWKDIAGMRDKIIHYYFEIDLDNIWDVITDDLPKLKEQIKKIIEKEDV